MKTKPRFLLFGLELTEGVDPGLAAGDAIRTTGGVTITPYAGPRIDTNYDKAAFGSSPMINTNPHVMMSFRTMLAGSSGAGVAPGISPVLQCCGVSETIVAVTSTTYASITNGIESGTGYFLNPEEGGINDLVHESNGMRGNCVIELVNGQFPQYAFEMTGSYTRPVTAVSVTPDFTAFRNPVAMTGDTTQTVTIDGYTACLQSFTLAFNNEVVRENLPNCQSTKIIDSNWGGTMVIKAPDVGDKDFFALLESHQGTSEFAGTIVHNSAAGEIITFNLSTIQLTDLSIVDVNGDVGYSFNYVDVDNTTTIVHT